MRALSGSTHFEHKFEARTAMNIIVYLIRSHRWADSFVRANVFGCTLFVWVGPLEMP
jgi:hypothetical protein